ncbi:hypothetical protein ACN4BX_10675 [Corynebacterium macclintockiae]|uniref:hypothetical protein n=1 Tax=Corynebacterium macclintockiae TaxID=2913501 RepID=UPI003EBB3580
MTYARVVFRYVPDAKPKWQYYGIDEAVVGGADSLHDAKEQAIEALEFHLDSDDVTVASFVERPALPQTDDHPAVFIRAFQDEDSTRRLRRQNISISFIEYLQQNPWSKRSFGGLTAGTGDVIAAVALPDDLLGTAACNVGEYDTILLGMPYKNSAYWHPLSSVQADDLPNGSKSLAEMGLQLEMTVADFMAKVGSFDPSRELTLTLA